MNLSILAKLHGIARLRKSAREVEAAERDLFTDPERIHAIAAIAEFLEASDESPPYIISLAQSFLEAERKFGGPAGTPVSPAVARAVNDFRHGLMREAGQAPADWDLFDRDSLHHPFAAAAGSPVDPLNVRPRIPGLRAYLEDLRSPFNVGTTFRTAEALGFEELVLSPSCADPGHPRAKRSAMGAVDLLPWRRAPLDGIGGEETLFALELGGIPLDEFEFPARGMMIIGSEELGVSSGALDRCSGGRVSIPLYGSKASLNVAVAFGIVARAWAFSRHSAAENSLA